MQQVRWSVACVFQNIIQNASSCVLIITGYVTLNKLSYSDKNTTTLLRRDTNLVRVRTFEDNDVTPNDLTQMM